jgi:integrase
MWKKEAKQYLEWKGTYLPKKTVKAYGRWVNRFGLEMGRGIAEILPYDIYDFSQRIQDKGYKPKTLEYSMTILKDYVGYWSKRKPLKIIQDDVRPPRAEYNPPDPVTPEEYVSMMTFIKPTTDKGLRDLVLLRMLYDTGARISEVAGLMRSDLRPNNCAHIRTAKGKGRKDYIFWGSDTAKFLEVYLDITDGEEVFPSIRTCQRIIQRYANLAGLKKRITCHSFRHGKAWRVLDNGGTVKDVQAILRHKSPISSFKYLNWNFSKTMERAQKFL